jgi:hypothetical protein
VSAETDLTGYIHNKYPDLLHADNSVNLESDTAKKLLVDYVEPQAFDKVGYARPLGGFFYQFFYAIIGAAISVVMYSFLLSVVFPWPESRSMVDIAGVLFMLIQTIFNIPTSFALEMFIGDYRIKDPPKMIQYIRFYIWYQAITGLFLVTGISYFVINMLKTGDLAWARWIMLIIILKEYPAFTNMFITIIRGLQKFNIEAGLNFAMYNLINPFMQVFSALFGNYVIGRNPSIGPMFGIAIGVALGSYITELINMFLTMAFVNKAIKPIGFSLVDLFIPYVSKEVMWKSIKFGFVVSIPSITGTLAATLTTLWWYEYVPAYLTFVSLSVLADSLANIIKSGGGINIYATISEAVNNGKKELTSYYISMIWKFVFFFKFAIGAILISFMPLIFEVLLVAGGAENYILAAAFIIPNIIATLIEQPTASSEVLILGANRPTFNTIMKILNDLGNIFFVWFWLVFLQLPAKYGMEAVIWIMPLGGFLPGFLRMIANWVYIHKKIAPVRIRKFGWQTFIAPLVPSILIFIIAHFWYEYVFHNMIIWFGGTSAAMMIAGVISILFAFVGCAMFFFFPMYSAFGGWDKNTMAIFDEAVKISGPSRFLFYPINKASHWFDKFPLFNRFVIPYEDALREADELMRERYIKDRIAQEVLASKA